MNDIEPTTAQDSSEADGDNTPPAKASRPTQRLALVLSVLALAATAVVAWQQQSASEDPDARLTIAEIQGLKRALAKLEGTADFNAETIQQVAARLDAQAGRLDTLPVRIDQIEALLKELPGTDEEARRKILFLEADWYLRLADTQLNVARNVTAAQLALSLADARFQALAEPMYTPIRDRISTAIGELQIRSQHPAAADAAAVQTIIARIPDLQLKANLPDSFGAENTTEADGEGVDRALNAISDAFSSVISVKRSDAKVLPQLSDADAALLRRSLLLELQTAKLAVLQNENAVFTQSLQVVNERLNQWFEPSSEAVAESLSDIEALLLDPARAPLPDIAAIRSDLDRLRSATP